MDAATSFATARSFMVDCQVRPNKVTDARILAAMRDLPRERFVPDALAPLAYSDEDVPLGAGRFLMEPMVIARLLQAASVSAGERVLVVAAGAGYGAAILARCGAAVTALEEDAALIAVARKTLPSLGPSVVIVDGRLVDGAPDGAPYDVVIIEGAVEDVPARIAAQVKPVDGRLLTIKHIQGRVSQAVIGERAPGDAESGLSFQPLFDCATPLLPSMRRVAGFVF
jgi:protein-L-isoaspartate(D-aspartate) O-methyltransferase